MCRYVLMLLNEETVKKKEEITFNVKDIFFIFICILTMDRIIIDNSFAVRKDMYLIRKNYTCGSYIYIKKLSVI